jgi:uncharacterized protein (DUF305 family)
MQINIDKKTGTFLGIILVLILAVVFLLAGNTSMSMNHDGHGSKSSEENASGTYTDDELKIAHHEGAIDMLSMIKNSTNSEVKKLYDDILTSQSAEIEAMNALLK